MRLNKFFNKVNAIIRGVLIEYITLRPDTIVYITTKKCQSKCRMCNIWNLDKTQDLSTSQIKNILSNQLFKKVKTIQFSGGEVFIKSDVIELVQIAINSLPKLKNIGFATNALSPTIIKTKLEKILNLLQQDESLTVQLSLHGIGDVHNKIMGVANAFSSFEKTLQELLKLKKKYFLNVTLNCVIQQENLSHLDELQNYAASKKLKIYYSPLIHSQYYNNKNNQSLNPNDIPRLIKFLTTISKKDHSITGFYHNTLTKILNGSPRRFMCLFGKSTVLLEQDGKVHPCVNAEEILFGDLLKEDAEKIWFSKQTKQLRKILRVNNCKNCTASCGINPFAFLKYSILRHPIQLFKQYLTNKSVT